MPARREPVRMCVVCRRRRPKAELVRIVHGPDGVAVDRRLRLPGRGAYLCPDCVDAAKEGGGRQVARALAGEGRSEDVVRALAQVGGPEPREEQEE